MGELMMDTVEETAKVSPFCYRDGAKINTSRQNGSMAEIQRMRQNGTLTELHRKILDVVYKYRYINSYLVQNALLVEAEPMVISPMACKQGLKKLYVSGLVSRHELRVEDEAGPHGSPFIYSVTDLGARLLRAESTVSFFPPSRRDDYLSVSAILERLAFSQFHIMFLKEYQGKGVLRKFGFYSIRKEKGTLPGYYELQSKGVRMCMMVYAVRNDPKWVQTYFSHLRCAHKVALEKSELPCFVLVVCENEQQAMAAERFRATDALVSDMDVYYVCERSLLGEEGVFSQLIQVDPIKDFSTYRFFKMDI